MDIAPDGEKVSGDRGPQLAHCQQVAEDHVLIVDSPLHSTPADSRLTGSPPPIAAHSPILDSPLHSSCFSSHPSPVGLSPPLENIRSLPLAHIPASPTRGTKTPEAVKTVDREDGSTQDAGTAWQTSWRKSSMNGRTRIDIRIRRALMIARILGFLFCLISFSVLAADRNQGWAHDSFHRYKEFRYCLSVGVIGFCYSGIQAVDVAYALTFRKRSVRNIFRCWMDFVLDQIMAYLLISASSSATFRVEDWEANWGKDEFPTMARASVALSYLAFVVFAVTSLLSGYDLRTNRI